MRITEQRPARFSSDVDRQKNIDANWVVPAATVVVILGIIAIACPFFTTLVSTFTFGWIFIFAGSAQAIYAIQSRSAGQFIGKLLLSFLYLLAGFSVLENPLTSTLTLTSTLGIIIFTQGITQIILAFQPRYSAFTRWAMLASGIVGIVVGILVGSNVTAEATWLSGALIGTNLLFDGLWMLSLHSANQPITPTP